MVFATIAGASRLLEPCGPQPPAAEARKHPAVAGRAPQAASEIIHNAFSCKTFARAGCRGRACGREPAPGARSSVSEREQILRDMLAIIVILSVSEESMMNAASAETACGLCRARRRKTNAVQSNICNLAQNRFFAPLRMTIMASMSRRLFLFLIRKTLRPGPARAESATPAAGPGEHTKNEYC